MADQAECLREKMSNTLYHCKTIAVVSGKGGVGKSNTALNFALELQRSGKKVLLLDLDVGMGNIDILLGKQPRYTIADLFHQTISIHDMIELGPLGLSYISGGSSLNNIVHLDDGKLALFFRSYEQLTKKYDYILLDLGAGLTESSLAIVVAADECFVVTTPEPTSITDAYSVAKHIVKRDKDLPIFVWMNRSESRQMGEKSLDKFAQVVSRFLQKDIIQMGTLPNDKTVLHAVSRQIPYTLYKENSPVSKAMKRIVKKYLEQTDGKKERSGTFIHKLKQLLAVRK